MKTYKYIVSLLFIAAGLASAGCERAGESWWDDPQNWFVAEGDTVVAGYADVLYFVSTEVLESRDAQGNPSYRATLDEAERGPVANEMGYMRAKVYTDSLNFFSPFYHQLTFAAYDGLPQEEMLPQLEATEQECFEAFEYYMEHLNGGRPYILAGYSQGAQMAMHILKNMTDKQFENMVATYMIGYELTEEDMQNPHVVPARSATDRGVTISFNSVATVDDIWTTICSNPAACINPVNWCTDATPAPLQIEDWTLTVSVDPDSQVVLVTGFGDDLPKPAFDAPWPDGCLHGSELRLYASTLGRNAVDRAY